MKRITLYSTNQCPHCETAKRYLESQKISFRLINVKSPAGQKEFAKTGFRAVPILKVGEDYLNGFSIAKFNKLLRS
ncbi:glutaredoxin family protein [Psychromonas sp. KJ10-10]|uniref:glutaredoxin family protein n=1 Tax=Psychromonas sp. KJ10-10 TaxID=3391823 RepID=UPI0039B4197F